MRHSVFSCSSWALAAVLLLATKDSEAFSFLSVSPQSRRHQRRQTQRSLSSSLTTLSSTPASDDQASAAATTATPARRKPLSPEEILKQQGSPEDDDEYPKLFDDDLLDNMQQMLRTLESRAKGGPGSLSMLEVEEFVVMAQDLTNEMKDKEYLRLQDAASAGSSSTAQATAAATIAATPVAEAAVEATQVAETAAPATEADSAETPAVEHNEDGPAYDPSGGQGSLAKGTRNTYVIDRMDEMSPEEYQKALQASISAQQEERRKQLMKTGGYGNRASWDYLNNLTGESGQLKSDSAFND